ncbi:MAG: SDR family NAD(P)-dependent oxidoreductase [Bacteroidales bacterium]|jgi:uncharacterized protein|nr:SDR family NAD(P)-dependent oxidoreductase [Bacteroidales bacterium]MCI1733491.1 SDR family NAD(P)-dependent oxidoreductase [Bacteroidales bacterium]
MKLQDWKINNQRRFSEIPLRPFALVTGGSSGMGAEYSKQLAALGYNILLVSNQEKAGIDMAAQISERQHCANCTESLYKETEVKYTGTGQCVIALYRNLALPDAAQELFDYCQLHNFDIEVLVNNAGMFFFEEVTDVSPAKIDTILNLHIHTLTMLCRLFGEKMKQRKTNGGGTAGVEQPNGYIINMSSISTFTPYCGITLYTATKSYIRTFSRAFYLEMKKAGIHVTVICPGAVATPLYNLKSNLMNLGVHLGIIARPQKIVRRALAASYKGRKECIPTMLDYAYRPFYALVPDSFKFYMRRKLHLGEFKKV